MSIRQTPFYKTLLDLENAQIAPFISINQITQTTANGVGFDGDQPYIEPRQTKVRRDKTKNDAVP